MRAAIQSIVRATPAWPIYPLGMIPILWLYYLGLTGSLGVEPVEVIEHRLGLWGLWLLLAGLTITPLMRHARINLIKYRRAIGVMAFVYILVHLLTWAILDVQSLDRVWADIVKRPYITVGMAGFALMLPLALTSNNWSVRRLGSAAWKRLHWLVYPTVLLGAVHFVMLAKGFQLEPLLYLAGTVVLLGFRVPWQRFRLFSFRQAAQ
ncbi:MAG: protein-methionine-sulfoxide reductase heme-binding subunit MsrQ [Pseudomonadota bacterium]